MIRSRKKLEWLLFNYGWFAVAIFQSRASFSLSFSFLGCSPGTGRRQQQQQQQQQHNRRRTTRMASSAAGMGASAPNNRTLSSNNNNNNNNNKNEILEIPIIGPLMNLPKPIVIGDSMWLDPPTPLQWKTIEAAVDAQNGRTLLWNPGSSSPSAAAAASTAMGATTTTAAANKLNLATTDGSPLVAILHNGGHEYATIAAVEGIATTKQQQQQKQQNGYTPSIDTTDAESFRESLARLTLGSPYYSDSSRIRLLAIGRAKLSYHQTKFLNEGFDFAFESNGNNNNNNENENENEQQPQHGTAPSEPLFVARMELLLDSIHDSGNGNGKYGSSSTSTSSTSRNKKASPVHALNRISGVAQRIRFLHDDRQRIARGLRAAQARLEMASDEWEDWDGIGSLDNTNINTNINTLDDNNNNNNDDNNDNNNPETTTTTTTTTTDGTSATTTTNPPTPQPIEEDDAVVLGQFLREYDSAIRNNGNSENGEGTGTGRTFPIPMHSMPLSEGAARCTELDNYGLGTTTAAAGSLFVPLSKLAGVLTERLEPYYSPERLSSEEFGYEALSWCVLQSLQAYLTPREIHAALYECTSTCGRLDLLYRAMVRHKSELTELAIAKTTELRNCGEECDLDLFG